MGARRQFGLATDGVRLATSARLGCSLEITARSLEHIGHVFLRAAAADRAVGSRLAGISSESTAAPTRGTAHGQDGDLPALRALACAAATAYARRLKAEGSRRNKCSCSSGQATANHGLLGFGTQALTSDIVTWSIDACFDERSDKPAQPRPG